MPAADAILQRLRQVPVIKRGIGLDAVGEQFIEQAVVEIESLGIRLACSFRKHPRPGDGETIRLDAEVFDEADVFLVAVVMLVGAIAVAAVLDLAGRVGKCVPDRTAAAILIDGAFVRMID